MSAHTFYSFTFSGFFIHFPFGVVYEITKIKEDYENIFNIILSSGRFSRQHILSVLKKKNTVIPNFNLLKSGLCADV